MLNLKHYRSLWLVFCVSFLDFLAFSSIIPFIPLLFIDPEFSLFSNGMPISLRYILLGLLYATYPLAQALGTPLLGHFSDKIGRRSVLKIAYLGNMVGYFLCSLGILYVSAIPFFLGYLISGLTGANISTANAIISDSAHNKKRSRLFGLMSMLLGLGFALGPYVSAKLLEHTQKRLMLCFYLLLFSCAISFINFLVVQFLMRNDKPQNTPIIEPKLSLFPFSAFFHLKKEKKILLTTVFFLVFGWYCFIKTFQVFLLEDTKLHEVEIFTIISYYGLCSLLTQALYITFLHRFIKNRFFIFGCLLILAVSISSLIFVQTTFSIFALVTLFSFAYSILTPALLFLVSEFSTQDTHGKTMGFYQSIMALAKITAPILASLLLIIDPAVALIASSLFILASYCSYKALSKSESCKVAQ